MSGKYPNICYNVSVSEPRHLWQTRNVLKSELPEIATSIGFTVLLSLIVFSIFKPLHQPRIVSYVAVST